MPSYRRWHVEGGLYFFTLVTHHRREVFSSSRARRILRESIDSVRKLHRFELVAIVLLPDHIHMMMHLPEGDSDFSVRIGGIKYAFTRAYLAAGGREAETTPGQVRHRNRGVWQKRFYEHVIRDYRDYKRHLDYVHANPVKHDLAEKPGDWQWSSFARYVNDGEYGEEWCGHVELAGVDIEPDTW